MVDRTKMQELDEFIGVVERIEIEPDKQNMNCEQYHIIIDPVDIAVQGQTKRIHEWVRISNKSTLNTVPEGSILDKYITELETLNKEVKKYETHLQVFKWMIGKKFRFIKKKLGKSFQGYDAKLYWVPTQLF